MRKKMVYRGLLGIPIGIAIGYAFTILGSLIQGSGSYYAVAAEVIALTGNELSAIILQAALCALLGAVSSGSSVIWEIDEWSLLKQTSLHFGILATTMLPIAYFLHWMDRSIGGFLLYTGIFIVQFFFIWIIVYFSLRHKIKKINDKLSHDSTLEN